MNNLLVELLNLANVQLSFIQKEGRLELGIPASYICEKVNSRIRQYEGRMRDNELEQIDLSDLLFGFTEGGFTLEGNFCIKFRKNIVDLPKLGKKYTPWWEITGSFIENINANVSEGKLKLSHADLLIKITDEQYKGMVNQWLLPFLKEQVIQTIERTLDDFNEQNIQELVFKYSQRKLEEKLNNINNILNQEKIEIIKNKFNGLLKKGIFLNPRLKQLNERLDLVNFKVRVSKDYLWLCGTSAVKD